MNRCAEVPFILTIDAEPDGHFLDRGRRDRWRGLERMVPEIQALRDRISRATGTPATFTWNWRLDPQITETYGTAGWGLERYAELAETLRREGDELGVHTHAYRWSRGSEAWIADYGNQEWIETCLRTAVDAYREILGTPPRTSSMGDNWLNGETVSLLEQLGIRHELTLQPRLPVRAFRQDLGRFTGARVDSSAVAPAPFQPSEGDVLKAGPRRRDGIWLIPLSVGRCPFGPGTPAGWRRRLPTLLGWRRTLSQLYLRLGPAQLAGAFEDILTEEARPYFNFGIRSSLALAQGALGRFRRSLDFMLGHRQAKRFNFCTPARALELLGLGPSPAP